MRQASHTLTIHAPGQGLHDCTREVIGWVRGTGIATGLLTLFVKHTSASLLIQENADPDVLADLNDFFARLVPEATAHYRHRSEGADDMPAHIRSALTQTHLSLPVVSGAPTLGTWQGIYLFEHRRATHRRQLALHLIGD